MSKHNIHIKIQLEKNWDSGELMVVTQFDSKAPNFHQEKENITWTPTSDEIDFLNEIFSMIPHSTTGSTSYQQPTPEPYKSYDTNKQYTPKLESEGSEQNKNKTEETKHEETQNVTDNKNENPEKIVIATDEQTLDNIIKKKQNEDAKMMKEADEQTILDRVLKQKRRGSL